MTSQISQKITMLKRWAKMLTGKTDVAVAQGQGRVCKPGLLAGYWNDLTGKVSSNTLLDAQGIPLSVLAGGKQAHFPIAICQYALGCYDLFLLTKKQSYLDSFKACADWLFSAQRDNGSWDAFGPIGSAKYTVSSMAQGEGASVLLRSYKQFGNESYLKAARNAIGFMLLPIEQGGTAYIEGGSVHLEEYPQIPRRSVLNGWIFSLFGLYDMSLIDPTYKAMFEQLSKVLASELAAYDVGYWSFYDLEHRIASPFYHSLHSALLKTMGEITDLNEYATYAARFDDYQGSAVCKARAVTKKVAQKLTEKSDAVIVQ